MKTKDELKALKAEVETIAAKLAELSEEELKMVVGGMAAESDSYSFQERDLFTDGTRNFIVTQTVTDVSGETDLIVIIYDPDRRHGGPGWYTEASAWYLSTLQPLGVFSGSYDSIVYEDPAQYH